VLAQSTNFCLDIRNFKRGERAAHWCATLRICLCDDEGALAGVVLKPVIAHRVRLDRKHCVVEATRYGNVTNRISYKRELRFHDLTRLKISDRAS